MKKIFEFTETGKDEIICKSFRDTTPQKLEYIYNKRKLNEFLYVIEKIDLKSLQFEIMKNTLYKKDSFFKAYQKNNFYQLRDKFMQNNALNFILAASFFGHFDILKWLLQSGYDINATNDYMKETGFHLASENGHLASVELLIKNGSKVNEKTLKGKTPLHLGTF